MAPEGCDPDVGALNFKSVEAKLEDGIDRIVSLVREAAECGLI